MKPQRVFQLLAEHSRYATKPDDFKLAIGHWDRVNERGPDNHNFRQTLTVTMGEVRQWACGRKSED